MPLDPLPPLKTDPKHGHFPWWPEDGDGWVHPEDVAAARARIPGPRVWHRDGETSAGFVVMQYGEVRIRVRRTLWITVEWEGYDLGDLVEVRPRGMTNEPHTGAIREMHWDAHAARLQYQLTLADGTLLERWFRSEDLKHVEPPVAESEVRRDPPGNLGEELELL